MVFPWNKYMLILDELMQRNVFSLKLKYITFQMWLKEIKHNFYKLKSSVSYHIGKQ